MRVEIRYSPILPPKLYATIHGIPRWPDYEISEYKVNITDTSDNSLLSQTTVLNSLDDTVEFNKSLQSSFAQECNTLRISVSAVSDSYGESDFTHIDTETLKSKQSF